MKWLIFYWLQWESPGLVLLLLLLLLLYEMNDEKKFLVFACLLFKVSTSLFSTDEFQPLDPTQELIFPPELMVTDGNFCCL